jgi:hypothetical protein
MSDKSFAEALYDRYKGQEVEIFTGNQTGTQLYNDFELQEQATITGIITDVDGDMLIIASTITTPSQQLNCEIAVNGWAIESVCKTEYGIGLLTVYGGHRGSIRKR